MWPASFTGPIMVLCICSLFFFVNIFKTSHLIVYYYYYGRHESNTSQLTFQLLIKLQSYLFMYSGRKCTFGRKKI